MQVIWTEAAISDLTSIRDYIGHDNPEAAELAAVSILNSVEKLETNPLIGRQGRVLGTRELVVTKFPYIIQYRVQGDRVELLRVLHGRQEWPE